MTTSSMPSSIRRHLDHAAKGLMTTALISCAFACPLLADGWAVGGNGAILKSTNLGESWVAQTSGTSALVNSVYFSSNTTGWVAGGQVILKTTNGGTNWVDKYTGAAALNSVYFITSSTGWSVGSTGAIVKSIDAGETWTPQTSGTSADLFGVHFNSATLGWAAGGQVILKTINGGTSWVDKYPGGAVLRSVFFVNASTGWAVGGSGTILKSIDGGENWTTQTSGIGTDLLSVYFVDTSTGWAAGPQVILKTTNGGTTWTDKYTGGAALQGLYFLNASTGWAVGTAGAIEKSTNAGDNWSPRTSGSSQTLKSVYFVNCSDADGDTYYAQANCGTAVDCNDGNAAIHPGAIEVCNNVDDDCDGTIDDGDPGGGSSCATGQPGVCATGTRHCQSGGLVCVRNQNPSTETCNNLDDDCDGTVDDGDPGGGASCSTGQQGVCSAGTRHCQSGSLVCVRNQNPSTETCNNLDDDCDGTVDDGDPGGGASCSTGQLGICSAGARHCQSGLLQCVRNNGPSPETCNGVDDDCDGQTDEGVASTFYRDADNDGYGDSLVQAQACTAPPGFVTDHSDCDDTRQFIHPGAPELCRNATDENCNGIWNEGCLAQAYWVDDDAPGDPGPNDPSVSDPLADGTPAHPFDAAQKALEYAVTGDTVRMLPGQYVEALHVRHGGCSIIGSGQQSTFVHGPSGTVLSTGIGEPISELAISDLTVSAGSLSFDHYDDGPGVFLSRIDIVTGNIVIGADSVEIELDSVNAPTTRVLVSGGISDSFIGMTMVDTTIASYEATGLYRYTSFDAHNIRFTGQGIDIGSNRSVFAQVQSCTFENGGVIVSTYGNVYSFGSGGNLQVRDSVFGNSGISISALVGGPQFKASTSVSGTLESNRFQRQGVTVSVSALSAALMDYATIRVRNNVFMPGSSGVDATYEIDDLNPLRLEVVNNTEFGTTTGVRLNVLGNLGGQGNLSALIQNNIVASGTTGILFTGTQGQQLVVTHNDVFNNTAGNYQGDLSDQTGFNGNISLDPVLRNPPTGAYDLLPGSPCVDAGIGSPEVPSTDITGSARSLDGDGNGLALPDMGAYEFGGDADGDGVVGGIDCDDTDNQVWLTPGDVSNLEFTSDAVTLSWGAPSNPGGTTVLYDLLRSTSPSDFVGMASCSATSIGLNMYATSLEMPGEGAVTCYLVRALNACPGSAGQGSLGTNSAGTLRLGRECP